jgi:AcrR family transcriptional regulator
MRRVGRALGVEAMSLYNHVADKDDLLDALVDRVLEEIELPSPGSEWKEAMRRRAWSARAALGRHPWAIRLLESGSRSSSARRLDYFDAVLRTLRAAGFGNQLAMRGFATLDAYVFGWILQQSSLAFQDDESLREVGADLLRQMADRYPDLTEVTTEVMGSGYDHDAEFAWGLELILEGLERRAELQEG